MTRRGVDPLFGKELMGIKSDRVFQRYKQGVFKQAAAEAYLKAIGEEEEAYNERWHTLAIALGKEDWRSLLSMSG